MHRIVTMAVAAVLVLSGCGGDDSGSTSDTGVPEGAERCEELGPRQLDFLRAGVVVDDVTLPWGYSVKSGDYDDVWIVTAGVQIPDDIDYGTWAVRAGASPTEYIGAVAVDEIAMRISSYGDESDIIVTSATDGVRSAQACALERLDAGG